jgi:hypothetical protein
MLNPDHRRLYTDALRPPPGYRFSEAIATTYSLELQTLLTMPLHLAVFSADQPIEELLRDGVALLEAIRRTTERLTVYAEASRILAPATRHVLYGLLEPAVVEVLPPGGTGSFHPKLWLLRFDSDGEGSPLVRLLVLTRNLTGDRCWDLVLTLEGQPTGRPRADNRPLGELVRRLPTLALRSPTPERIMQAERMAELVRRTEFSPPAEYEAVRFHTVGLDGRRGWLPPESDSLAVISPFLSEHAVRRLLETTDQPIALVSRPEALARVPRDVLASFQRVLVLAEQAEREDGDDTEAWRDAGLPNHGLHAKAYLLKRGWNTHLFVGSANATNPALVRGTNVEVIAELVGKRTRAGMVDDLLGPDGFGSILVEYVLEESAQPPNPEVERAREALEDARRSLASSGLCLRFTLEDNSWAIELLPKAPLTLPGVSRVRTWLVTRDEKTAQDATDLRHGAAVPLPVAPLELLTSFVAFELSAEPVEESIRFVLNLPALGLPVPQRDAAVVRGVIRNREGFLRYVMLLLAEAGTDGFDFGKGAGTWNRSRVGSAAVDELPLFEHLTRALCRDPERLRAIRRLVEDLGAADNGEVMPAGFLDLWQVFEAALSREGA